ncbi:MAG: DUF3343 domain-containing protein [Deltaproteobacteria bacterium]|nr:DUF3343 domain-containing protein [Deltaproteobacteria bacterium]
MNLFTRALRSLRNSDAVEPHSGEGLSGRGILIFERTSEVIAAETALRKAGVHIAIKGPPPEIQTGCDMAIEFPIVDELEVTRVLSAKRIKPVQMLPLQDTLLEPVSLYNTKDFGDYLMVRAANMKMTIRKTDRTIVNISGGGCPDVPFLAERLVGKTLEAAREPRTLGNSLCGYALQMAYDELRRQCLG